jgi:type I restriction enzyme, S subunit
MQLPHIDVSPEQWAIVHAILKRQVPQYAVWAFGSRATWKAKPFSDLDLAIITPQPLSLSTSAALTDDFAESDLPFKVDIVDWAATSAAFRKIIERDKVVLQSGDGV